MKRSPLPEQSLLSELLDYDAETGRLTWRRNSFRSKYWHSRFAGREAFTQINDRGYKCGRIDGRDYKAHRIIWKIATGTDPLEIDHINRDRADNRLTNLRSVDHKENCAHMCIKKARAARWPKR